MPPALRFPLNFRVVMRAWDWLYFKPGILQPEHIKPGGVVLLFDPTAGCYHHFPHESLYALSQVAGKSWRFFGTYDATQGRLATELTSLFQGGTPLEEWSQGYGYDGAGEIPFVGLE